MMVATLRLTFYERRMGLPFYSSVIPTNSILFCSDRLATETMGMDEDLDDLQYIVMMSIFFSSLF